MKKLLVFAVVLVVLFFGLSIIKNTLIKSAVKTGVKVATGLKLEIDSMQVGLTNTLLGIEGLRLRNPEGFEDPYMVNLPEIYVDYDLGALLKKKVHLPEVRLHLEEFMVVTDASGKLNLDSFKPVQESQKAKDEAPVAEQTVGKKEPMDLKIDRLSLKVGRVIVKDYSKGGEPTIKEYKINIDKEYTNITSAKKLSLLVMTAALMPAGLNLPGIDLSQLNNVALSGVNVLTGSAKQVVGSAVGVAEGMTKELGSSVGQVGNVAGETAETAAEAGKEVVGAAADAVEKTADSLKKLVPFGN